MTIDLHAEKVLATLDRASEIASALHLDGNPPMRHRIAWALLRLAFDHCRSIAFLLYHRDLELQGSAFALARVANDALARGAWFALHASDEQAEIFSRDDRIATRNMSAEIELHEPFDRFNVFTMLRQNAWEKLNSFTHSGSQAVGAYLIGEGIGPGHYVEDIDALLEYAESASVVAVLILLIMVEDQDAARIEPLQEQLGELMQTPRFVRRAG